MDDNEVWKVLCVPVDEPLVAVVVDKHILVDVQFVAAAKRLPDDGILRSAERVPGRFIVPVCPEEAAVDGRWRRAGERTWQTGNLLLGELKIGERKVVSSAEHVQRPF